MWLCLTMLAIGFVGVLRQYRWQITAGVIATGGKIAFGVNMIDDEKSVEKCVHRRWWQSWHTY